MQRSEIDSESRRKNNCRPTKGVNAYICGTPRRRRDAFSRRLSSRREKSHVANRLFPQKRDPDRHVPNVKVDAVARRRRGSHIVAARFYDDTKMRKLQRVQAALILCRRMYPRIRMCTSRLLAGSAAAVGTATRIRAHQELAITVACAAILMENQPT